MYKHNFSYTIMDVIPKLIKRQWFFRMLIYKFSHYSIEKWLLRVGGQLTSHPWRVPCVGYQVKRFNIALLARNKIYTIMNIYIVISV
jgi:hypothetical protein